MDLSHSFQANFNHQERRLTTRKRCSLKFTKRLDQSAVSFYSLLTRTYFRSSLLSTREATTGNTSAFAGYGIIRNVAKLLANQIGMLLFGMLL